MVCYSPRTIAANTRSLEATLWDAADKMRGNLEASEYKHVALGLVFLKDISDAIDKSARPPNLDEVDDRDSAALPSELSVLCDGRVRAGV